MPYFRIQMHPDWSDHSVVFAQQGLRCMGAIGLDFDLGEDPLENLSLNNWKDPDDFERAKRIHERLHNNEGVTKSLAGFYHLEQGDIILLHGGMIPVALVEVTGPYYMVENNNQVRSGLIWEGNDEYYWDWPRHRIPVKILGWYEEDSNNCVGLLGLRPPSQGTFSSLRDNTSETFKKMSIWESFSKKKEESDNPVVVGQPISVEVFENFKQIILHGPPGTSKTYQAKRMAAKLMFDINEEEIDDLVNDLVNQEEKSGTGEFADKRFRIIRDHNKSDEYKGQWAIVQFHPAYNYEDFVRGIQVSGQDEKIRYENVQRIFSAMCKAAENNKDKKYVLIIDEINRAHIAAVLGELIYGLEYRNARITTPYAIEGDDTLSVPKNLYIIGTMNTADRSIGHIDYAVRRRFAFIACPPNPDVLENYYNNKTEALKNLAKLLFEAVCNVFKKENLNEFDLEDVCPGHTYFMAENEPKLRNKFIYQVYPLLREYYKDGILRQNVTQMRLPNGNMVPLDRAVSPHKLLDML